MPTRTVVAIPDLHFPFHNSKALNDLLTHIARIKPDSIVCLGDLMDAFAFSKFPKSMNILKPRDEMDKARDLAEEMWKKIKKSSPKSSCYLLTGNHDLRPYKRILERAPEFETFLSFKEYFEFQGVETIHDPRDELIIDDVIYVHGFLSGIGKHLNHFQQSVVFGHLHSAHLVFQPRRDKMLFEMCCGYLANPKAVALSYTPSKITKWQTGYGIVDLLGPRFVPLDTK